MSPTCQFMCATCVPPSPQMRGSLKVNCLIDVSLTSKSLYFSFLKYYLFLFCSRCEMDREIEHWRKPGRPFSCQYLTDFWSALGRSFAWAVRFVLSAERWSAWWNVSGQLLALAGRTLIHEGEDSGSFWFRSLWPHILEIIDLRYRFQNWRSLKSASPFTAARLCVLFHVRQNDEVINRGNYRNKKILKKKTRICPKSWEEQKIKKGRKTT